MNSDCCVCCGGYVPEGRQVCSQCESNGARIHVSQNTTNIAHDEVHIALRTLQDEIDKYRHSMFVIGETCVDASKRHITPERALAKIRKNIYYKSKNVWEDQKSW